MSNGVAVTPSRSRSPEIAQQLRDVGVARVIAILAPMQLAASSTQQPDLTSYFSRSELSQPEAIARSLLTSRASVAAAASAAAAPPPVRRYPHLGLLLGTVDEEGLEGLERDPRVSEIVAPPHISLIHPISGRPAAQPTALPWGIEAMRVPELWKSGLTGQEVKIAHLDTGVDGKHPALQEAIEKFARFDELGERVSPDPIPTDSADHGTHTAATIAGRPVGKSQVGVAPEALLYSAAVIENGDLLARVLAGMDWAVEEQVKILNMSLGFRGYWHQFVPIMRILAEKHVLPVIAIGNEGPGTSRSPGNYVEVVSVGAVDKSGKVPQFSSSQRFLRDEDPVVPDLVAPGVGIVSALPGNSWGEKSGTSMATPHISGLCALLAEAHPRASIEDVQRALLSSCKPLHGELPERYGRGLPDAVVACRELTGHTPGSPRGIRVSLSSSKPNLKEMKRD